MLNLKLEGFIGLEIVMTLVPKQEVINSNNNWIYKNVPSDSSTLSFCCYFHSFFPSFFLSFFLYLFPSFFLSFFLSILSFTFILSPSSLK